MSGTAWAAPDDLLNEQCGLPRHEVQSLFPVGTMAFELHSEVGGMFGPQMATTIRWAAGGQHLSGSSALLFYDTYGWRMLPA